VPHHGEFREWHFIDLGCKAGDPDLLAHPPTLTITNGEIVTALKRCVNVIKNQTPDSFIPDEKVALALIMHLVGDIHQPLHCTAHYFDAGGGSNPPKHDGGGNAIAVPKLSKTSYKNLHTFWDQAYRRYRTPVTGMITVKDGPPETSTPNDSEVTKWAKKAKKQAPESSVSLNTDITQWAKETHAIGCDFAYGKIPAADIDAKQTTLKSTYLTNARKIARKQLAVAGYRLAALLNELFPE
jgi:hypothetical protein